jgi:aminopeptidase N
MYSKGANLLHTIRAICGDDEKWRNILRGLNKEFYHKTVTTKEIENYISKSMNVDLSKVFNQYLRDVRIPIFEYEISEGELKYRWINVIPGFDMPLDVSLDNKSIKLFPVIDWKYLKTIEGNLEINKNYYVDYNEL